MPRGYENVSGAQWVGVRVLIDRAVICGQADAEVPVVECVVKFSARNCNEKRSESFVFLSSDMFQMFRPGVDTVSRPAFALAHPPGLDEARIGFAAT